MSLFWKSSIITLAAVLCFSSSRLPGDEPEDTKESEATARSMIDAITMLGIREDGSRYTVSKPRLLMKIYDADRGRQGGREQTGSLWAWGDGRPVAITEFWRWKGLNNWGNTFVSTTPGLVSAMVDDKTWKPAAPGLRFQKLEVAPEPAQAAEELESQMADLVKRFAGFEMLPGRRIVDLQMMPDALDRYESEGVHGAVFALAHSNNPEALLFIEAVSDPIERSYWRYAWAKCTSSPVFVELDGKEVLHIPGDLNYLGSESEPFWVIFRSVPE